MIRTVAPFASFAERAVAQLVDVVVVLIGATILGIYFSQTSTLSIYLILSINYFMYFHQKFGQTPGKMIMDIRVVTLDDRKFLPTPATFLREITRLFLPLTLFIGYLIPFIDENKQALHDKIAKTCVIKNSREEFSFVRLVTAISVSLILLALTGFYTLIASPWPLQQISKQLEKSGIEISSIEGSLLNGFSFKFLQLRSSMGVSNFKNLNFKCDILKALSGDFIVIDQLDIESGKFIASNESIVKKLDQQLFKVGTLGEGSGIEQPWFFNLKKMMIKSISIKKMQFVYKNNIAYVDKALVENLELDAFTIPTGVKRVYISTDLFLLDIGGVQSTSESIQFERPVFYTLYSSLFDNLKIAIKGQIEPQFHGKNLQSIKFIAFDNHLRGELDQNSTNLSLHKFAPKDFFWGPLPFTQLNISTNINAQQSFEDSTWNGSVKIGNKTVAVIKNKFTLGTSIKAKGTLIPQGLVQATLGESTAIILWNNPMSDHFLAKAYFNSPIENVSGDNRVYLDTVKTQFAYKSIAPQNNRGISEMELQRLRNRTREFLRKGKRTPATN